MNSKIRTFRGGKNRFKGWIPKNVANRTIPNVSSTSSSSSSHGWEVHWIEKSGEGIPREDQEQKLLEDNHGYNGNFVGDKPSKELLQECVFILRKLATNLIEDNASQTRREPPPLPPLPAPITSELRNRNNVNTNGTNLVNSTFIHRYNQKQNGSQYNKYQRGRGRGRRRGRGRGRGRGGRGRGRYQRGRGQYQRGRGQYQRGRGKQYQRGRGRSMSTGRKMVRGRERYFHGRSFYKYGKQHDQGYIHNKIFIEKIEKVEINLFKND